MFYRYEHYMSTLHMAWLCNNMNDEFNVDFLENFSLGIRHISSIEFPIVLD